MSTNAGSAPGTTIPGVTGTGAATAKVTIRLDRSVTPVRKILDPATPVAISFTHDEGVPQHALPHGITWEVLDLQPGERIELQLDSSFPGYVQNPRPFHLRPWWENLKRVFPSADVLPSGAFGWELTPGTPWAVSGHAAVRERFQLRDRAPDGRPLLRYAVVFFDAQGAEHVLDPDVDVTPDP